ncbi:MAG: aldo/keto reductase [Anaerolineales bacterium]|nr:aldo/keto reductase [Anaerolineales bacterium]
MVQISDFRALGSTGLQVSPIGIGLAALGRPGYINLGHAGDLEGTYEIATMEARAHRVLDAAFEAGVTYFDAARSYGRAEAFLGSWLRRRDLAPAALAVGSKWGYRYTAGWHVQAERHEIKEHSLAMLQTQWRESRDLLAGHLDLYQIHSATLESGVLDNHEVLAELARLKEKGVAIGLSTSGPRQDEVIHKAFALEIDGRRLFDSVQSTWNLLEQSAGEALRQAHEAGLGVIIKEAVANGRLTPRGKQESFLPVIAAEARRLNTTIDALAIASILAQPWADLVLSGAASPEQLNSNLLALGVQLDEEARENLSGLAEPVEAYWDIRSRLAWN